MTQYTSCPRCELKGWYQPAPSRALPPLPMPPHKYRVCRYCGHDNRLVLAERALQVTFDVAHRKLARMLDKNR